MMLIQAGFPDTKVKTLYSAQQTVVQRAIAGGPLTARVEDPEKGRHYVLEIKASVVSRGGPNPHPRTGTGTKRHRAQEYLPRPPRPRSTGEEQ